MKKVKKETFISEAFGFPVQLINVPMRFVAGEWVVDVNFNELQRAILRLLIYKPTPLMGAELRFIRKYLNLTTTDFGKIFGVTHAAVIKWENEKAHIPPVTDFYIRLHMLAHLHAKDKELRILYEMISPENLASKKGKEAFPISLNLDEPLKIA